MNTRISNWSNRAEQVIRVVLGLMLLAAAFWAVADGHGGGPLPGA